VLAVLGSNREGLEWASAALTNPESRAKLAGNLAVISADQIATRDTRASRVGPSLTSDSGQNARVLQQAAPYDRVRPDWLLPVLAFSLVLMSAIVVGDGSGDAARASTRPTLNLWIEPFQFDPGIGRGEPPVHSGARSITVL